MACLKPFLLAVLSAIALAGPFDAFAQRYPSRPIKVIVPLPPGGGQDLVARAVSERLAVRLGQTFVIENKPGATGNIGTEAAAKSPTDGYTLLLSGVSSSAIGLTYYRKLGYDIRRDFAPITMIGHGTSVLIVTPGLKAASVAELIALAKAKPGELNFASNGAGGFFHLTGEMFKQMAGIDAVYVPYKGTAQFVPDIMDGRISFAIDNVPAYLPHIKTGKVRALAVATRERSPLLPDLPTMAEAGLPGFEAAAVYALLAPLGTPKEIVALLHRETNVVLAQPELREKLAAQGIVVYGSSPEELQAFILGAVAKWAKVIKDANIKPE
ncbi:MAG: Bug family tripartite tricarboxylate transporter substrate binding protein [Burkholderiales bacterium]